MTDFYVHPSSYIDQPTEIGANTKIWHFSHVMRDCKIGINCNIGQNVFIASGVILGNGVKVQNNVSIYTGVICEDDVFLGPSMVFTNVINPRSFVERKSEYKNTIIKKGASIGANATVVCGNNIGKYSLIGAGTVVTKDVPGYAIYFGSPGKIQGWICKCGEKLNFFESLAACSVCGQTYLKISEREIRED
ncbi:MAG: acyltransferase [Bacillota bacterium]